MTRDEVFEKLRGIVVNALGAEEEDVTPEAKLKTDLGMESIDLLDILFQIEKTFNIKVPQGEILPGNMLSNPEYVVDGKLTASGLAFLKQRMPYSDFTEFEKNPEVNNIWDLLTVRMLHSYVVDKVGAQG